MLARFFYLNSDCIEAQQPNIAAALQRSLIVGKGRADIIGFEDYDAEDEDDEQAYTDEEPSTSTIFQPLSGRDATALEQIDDYLRLDKSWVRLRVAGDDFFLAQALRLAPT
jgi:hypothetical protein